MARPGIADIHQAALSDPGLSLDKVRAQLLNKIGEGAEPCAATPGLDGTSSFGGAFLSMGQNQHHSEFRAAVTDSLLIRNGLSVKSPHPAARDLVGMSLVDVAATLLSHSGRTVRGLSKIEILAAGMTTSDLPSLLENIANKALVMGFRENEAATHRLWVRESTLPDFKVARRVALSEAPGLDLVPESAEYKQGALSDSKESIQLATYGKILNLSRQMLINDDLGELTRTPQALGAAAMRKEADLVYAVLTTNGDMRDGNPLFDAEHSNLAGTGAALSATTLGAGRAAMRKQKGISGQSYLNITPAFLLVPAELETTAEQLMTTLTPNQVSSVIPAWIRNLMVIAEPRLSDDSAASWYLATQPGIFDTIEVARLDSNPVTAATQEFTTDAMKFKVTLDVAAIAVDWRGIYKNPGM